MGFPHCPICVALASISLCLGLTRSYMFFILFKVLMREEFKSKLKFSFY